MSSLLSLPATIEQQLSYWKWDFTSLDLFSGELAYSLIYDNVRPDRIQEALQTVGMDTLPNYFILIQIDDYLAISKQLEITREFFQKDLVVNTIRSCLENLQVPGFAANLINSDRVICFLCLEELPLEPVEDFLGFLSRKSDAGSTFILHIPYRSAPADGVPNCPIFLLCMSRLSKRSIAAFIVGRAPIYVCRRSMLLRPPLI
ncbi:hypothetical protein ACTQ4E_09475 [Lawsonibacter sp. LCP25S3_G6]|uniref:hypothetical protein n=1 Tax=unclassified Lawsonibacter TaxID=2617946 RepID=UPI003F961D3C